MQSINIFDILGIFGSLIIAFAYFYSQYKHTFLNSVSFFIGNIVGSGLIILSLIYSSFNVSSFIIEVLWISVSIYGLLKYNHREVKLFNATIYQDELNIDNKKTELEDRYFKKEDLGADILFKNPETNEVINEKSGFLKTFLFNGTTMITPNAISSNKLNINSLDNSFFSERLNLLILDMSKNIEYSKDYFEKNIKKEKDLVLFFKTGFIKENLHKVKDGFPLESFFKYNRLNINKEAVKYIGSLDYVKAIVIDGISYESDKSKEEGMTNTFYLMGMSKDSFKPLIYHSKTPEKDFQNISIRIGNIPKKMALAGYPVELYLF